MSSLLDQVDLTSSHLITVAEDGVTVAVLEYDWVGSALDMLKADRGERVPPGPVLYVSNIKVLPGHSDAIWKLRALLPAHRHIVGLTETWKLKAPKGVPHEFYE